MLASFLSQTQGKKKTCSQHLFWSHLGVVVEVTSTNMLKPVCLCFTDYSISVVPGAQEASLHGTAILPKHRESKECQSDAKQDWKDQMGLLLHTVAGENCKPN